MDTTLANPSVYSAVGEQVNQPLLELVGIRPVIARGPGINDLSFGDPADLAAQVANLLRVVTAERGIL